MFKQVHQIKTKKGDTLGLKGGYTLDDGSSKAPMLDAKTKKPIPRDPYQLQNYDPVYANESRLGSRAVKNGRRNSSSKVSLTD